MNYIPTRAKKLKIVKIGNSVGVVLPREVLAKLRVDLGDDLYVTETPQGVALRPDDADFVEAMTLAEGIMREDREILAVLAK